MDAPEPSAWQVVAGLVMLVVLFVAREVASGALNAAGRDLWAWVKRRAWRRHPCRCDEAGRPRRDDR